VTVVRPVRPFGDGAVVVETDTVDDAHRLAAAIAALDARGIDDVIVGFRSVTVVADPTVTDVAALGRTAASLVPGPGHRATATVVEMPVAFDGPDLDDVARLARLSPSRVVDLLTSTDLQVAFVGFAPGFAYLVGLPPDLASVPRRPTPRPAVPGGSVALAGGFAGIYPQTSPGGWQLVGRTAMGLFDPETPPFSLLGAGDVVRLRLDDVPGRSTDVPAGPRPPLRSRAARTVVVENAGLLSFVQDRGRIGVAGLGVPGSGAADPYSLRMANLLVGNVETAAAIETTARGPTLTFSSSAHVAVVGPSDVTVDGRDVPSGTVLPVSTGQTVTVGGRRDGLRAYVAIAGGIDIAPVLGSRSSDVLCGLGAGALTRGDVLGLGGAGIPRGRIRPVAAPATVPAVRIMMGPDAFPPAAVERLLATTWQADPTSNRIGVRLRSGAPLDTGAVDIASRGMVTGAIQVPPDGRPIVLLCDHATVGGYPVIATVVTADLGMVGQLRPGDPVHFAPVDLVEATRARVAREQEVAHAAVGWYPVRTD
jgi:KipI family sensor histidine kinase inhibitor